MRVMWRVAISEPFRTTRRAGFLGMAFRVATAACFALGDVVPRAGIALAIGEQRGGKCLDAHLVPLKNEARRRAGRGGLEKFSMTGNLLGFFCYIFAIAFSWRAFFW
jgi:hypothetical protein